jgi:hypothetical protein
MTTGHQICRKVAGSTLAMAIVLAAGTFRSASAGTLNFEDSGLNCQTPFLDYAGFTFSSWVTQCDDDYLDPLTWGNTSGAPSSVTAAGNTYFDPSVTVTITRALPFDLLSGKASAFLVNDDVDFSGVSSSSLLIEGYLEGVFVSSLPLNFDPAAGGLGPGYHSFGSILGVDELRFFSSYDLDPSSNPPNHWLVDDLVFADAAVPVPEPATSLLLLSGLGALGTGALFCRRKFRGHKAQRSAS